MAEPPPTPVPLLVTKTAIVQMTSLSKRTIESLMCRGLPHVRLSYRCVRFNPDEVMAYLSRKFGMVRRSPIGRFGR